MRKGRIKYYFKNKNAVINDVGKLCDMNEQLEKELERLNKQYDLMEQSLDDKQKVIDKAIEMFDNQNLNKYYYGMSYEFEINDFKEDMLNILQGSDE